VVVVAERAAQLPDATAEPALVQFSLIKCLSLAIAGDEGGGLAHVKICFMPGLAIA
jgi:hypothetical protein